MFSNNSKLTRFPFVLQQHPITTALLGSIQSKNVTESLCLFFLSFLLPSLCLSEVLCWWERVWFIRDIPKLHRVGKDYKQSIWCTRTHIFLKANPKIKLPDHFMRGKRNLLEIFRATSKYYMLYGNQYLDNGWFLLYVLFPFSRKYLSRPISVQAGNQERKGRIASTSTSFWLI